MTDPRVNIIDSRTRNIGKIIAVSSGKGGVGKSLIASTLALTLARQERRVGLFDLDFTSPSTHKILGVENLQPAEEKGIVPPEVHGMQYMSIVYYTHDHATPLRGTDVSNALIELLAITRWSSLDYLFLDMPPGIGDATLDLIRLIKSVSFLIVTTPSLLAFETVKKLHELLKTSKVPIMGIVENMKMNQSQAICRQSLGLGLDYMGEIPYDPKVEEAIGNVDRLMETEMARKVKEVFASRL